MLEKVFVDDIIITISNRERSLFMKQKVSATSSLDVSRVKGVSLRKRKSKVRVSEFGRAFACGGSLRDFLNTLPRILAGKDFREVIKRTVAARRQGRPVIFGMGAHVIKVGLSPVIIQLIKRGLITLVTMNGAGIIHDLEIALAGKTSEDVDTELPAGRFGMASETGQILNDAISQGAKAGLGLGQAVARAMEAKRLPYSQLSIVLAAAKKGIPLTCHVALGTDIIHLHPAMDGAATGQTSYRDFQIFSSMVARLNRGVYFNIGSAVILPEVFLKAVSLARNLGHNVTRFTTVNMDFISHYRPLTNVVRRPTAQGGKGYNLIGHHEIMLPLLAAALVEEMEAGPVFGKERR